MPASEELPRGATTAATQNGVGALSITIPAAPNIIHVLTHISVRSATIVAQFTLYTVTVSGGSSGLIASPVYTICSSAGVTTDADSWDGQIATETGESLIVAFSPNVVANSDGTLVINWYDT